MLCPKLLSLVTIAQVRTSVEKTAGVSIRPGIKQPRAPVPVAAGQGELGAGGAGGGASLAPHSSLKPFHLFRFCGFFRHWLCLHKEEIYATGNDRIINNL